MESSGIRDVLAGTTTTTTTTATTATNTSSSEEPPLHYCYHSPCYDGLEYDSVDDAIVYAPLAIQKCRIIAF